MIVFRKFTHLTMKILVETFSNNEVNRTFKILFFFMTDDSVAYAEVRLQNLWTKKNLER